MKNFYIFINGSYGWGWQIGPFAFFIPKPRFLIKVKGSRTPRGKDANPEIYG